MKRKGTANLFLLVCAVIGPSLGIHLPEECEVKSELKISYRGTDINFSVWVPDSASEVFLQVEIEFEGHNSPLDYDCALFSRNEVRFKRTRNSKPSPVNISLPQEISEGWADFTFTMTSQYAVIYHGNNMVLPLNATLDYMPKSVILTGNNITVNCPSNLRAWNGHESPVYVPLDNAEQHSFTFFSRAEFLPRISIEQREYFLGMDNGLLTTVPTKAKPLPAFEEHHLVISCQGDKCFCTLLVGKNKTNAEAFEVDKKPKSVSIRSKEGDFFVLLHGVDQTSAETEPTSCKEAAYPVLIGILVLLIVIIIILSFFLIKIKVCHGRKEEKKSKKTASKFWEEVQKKFFVAGKGMDSEDEEKSEAKRVVFTESLLGPTTSGYPRTASQDSAVCLDEETVFRKSYKAYEEQLRANNESL